MSKAEQQLRMAVTGGSEPADTLAHHACPVFVLPLIFD
jgi:hypothetical protein